MAIKTGVVGAAGFAGIEAVRLLLGHPDFQLVAATSDELAGRPLASCYPGFAGATDLAFSAHADAPLGDCEVVFLAVPHTAALAMAPDLVQSGAAVIDLSADFRLKDPAVYEAWYGVPHTQRELLAEAAFGLPELFPEGLQQQAARFAQGRGALVACAGCYPTATSLAAAPLVRAGLLGEGPVVADAVSGVTGAGKKANARTHFCSADENLAAYGVASHRHTPEIEQILGLRDRLVFTPHLGPLKRGILSTVTMPLVQPATQQQLDALYAGFYAGAPFVTYLGGDAQPQTSSVAGTNRAHVSAVADGRTGTAIATCAIDNLCKGAAGQAVQCANIVCGLPETAGLDGIGLPV